MSDLIVWEKWVEQKKILWRRFWEDVEIGYMDRDLIDILIRLNTDRYIYTKSSCSGRIVVCDTVYPWSREESGIVFKKHGLITSEELLSILNKQVLRNLWLNVSGPILHLSVYKPSYVKFILGLVREAGFKHSGVLSINRNKGIIIEVVSGVKMSHLLKTPSKNLVYGDFLDEIVAKANEVYMAGKRLLDRLRKIVYTKLPLNPDEDVLNYLKSKGILIV